MGGVDVRVVVFQLWTIYLRKLKMGFEKDGVFCPSLNNLSYRDRWNLLGGPPVLHDSKLLYYARNKRNKSESSKETDEGFGDDQDPEWLRKRRDKKIRRKKQKNFFASQSSDGDTSASEVSSVEDDISEDGFITDPQTLAVQHEQLPKGNLDQEIGFYHLDHEKYVPTILNVVTLTAIMALAVVSRHESSITLSDICRLLNWNHLTWKGLHKFLPSYIQVLYSDFQILVTIPRFWRWTENRLGTLCCLMASFLHLNSLPSSVKFLTLSTSNNVCMRGSIRCLKREWSNTQFGVHLSRIVSDLGLPKELAKDILDVFYDFLLTDLTTPIRPYTNGPDQESTNHDLYHRRSLPSPSLRIMALILVSLKFHCGLDDQTEVIWHRNIELLHRPYIRHFQEVQEEEANFSLLTWIRLSKLRLSHLSKLVPEIRHQYSSILAPIGTPSPSLSSLVTTLRDGDITNYMGRSEGPALTYVYNDRLSILSSALKGFGFDVSGECIPPPSLTPLTTATSALLAASSVSQNVKMKMEKLLTLPDTTMEIYSQKKEIYKPKRYRHGVTKYYEKCELSNNWVSSQSKFADLRGKDVEFIREWRIGRVVNKIRKSDVVQNTEWDFKANLRMNQHKFIEVSDLASHSFPERMMMEFETAEDYLKSLDRNEKRTERTFHKAPRAKPLPDEKFAHVTRFPYWFSHPGDHHMNHKMYRTSGNKKSHDRYTLDPKTIDPKFGDRLFHSLPANYVWLLKYLACYACTDPLYLHVEVANIERMMLIIDPNYFGSPRILQTENLDMWNDEEQKIVEKIIMKKEAEKRKAKRHERKVKKTEAQLAEKMRIAKEKYKGLSKDLRRIKSFEIIHSGPGITRCLLCWNCAKEDCGNCPACRDKNESQHCINKSPCVGLTYKPVVPKSAICCGVCTNCIALHTNWTCGSCYRCKDMPKYGGSGRNGKKCRQIRHCVEDCGVCAGCKQMLKFGGPGNEVGCIIAGQLIRSDREKAKMELVAKLCGKTPESLVCDVCHKEARTFETYFEHGLIHMKNRDRDHTTSEEES